MSSITAIMSPILNVIHRHDNLANHFNTFACDVRGINGKPIGLLGVCGIVLHGGGQLFHAGGGLLFGAMRQIIVAGGNLFRRCVNAVGGLLDLADNSFKFFYCRIGVILELPESAGIVVADNFGQVAAGQRIEYPHDFIQSGFTGLHELVDIFAQRRKKPSLPSKRMLK